MERALFPVVFCIAGAWNILLGLLCYNGAYFFPEAERKPPFTAVAGCCILSFSGILCIAAAILYNFLPLQKTLVCVLAAAFFVVLLLLSIPVTAFLRPSK